VLAFSDIRSQPLDDLVAHLRRLQHRPDLIIYAGDDVLRFRDGGKNYFEDLASIARFGLVGVIGNDDGPDARGFLSGRGVFEVHSQPVRIGDILVVGIEGAPNRRGIGIGSPLYSEAAIARHLKACSRDHKGPIFIVSHAPPFKILDQAIRFGMNNIGSRALRTFARFDRRVQLIVCGHCHKQGGKATQFYRATVINAASHDGPDDLIRIAHYRWRRGYQLLSGSPDVDFEYARPWGELEAITGLWHTDFTKLWKAGITTVAHLAATSAESLGAIVGRRPQLVQQFPILARARLSGSPLPIKPLYAIALPCTGFGLKTVAASLGFKYRHDDMDGFMVAVEYMHLSRAKKRIPKRFLEYNEDDVRAVRHVVSRAEEIAGYGGWPPPKRTPSKPPAR
jgi:Icc-related predicted phosphoesterase